jgi:NAD(P)H-nitrite reductase large subunit
MACALHPAPESALDGAALPRPAVAAGAVPAPMTRCECADVSFQEIARTMAASGAPLDEALRRTGCGQTCTACVRDLARFVSSL